MFVKWKQLIVIGILGTIAGGVYSVKCLPKVYESHATIYVQQAPSASNLLRSLPASVTQGSNNGMGYNITVLQSENIRSIVIRKLNLMNDPDFTEGKEMSYSAALGELETMTSTSETKNGALFISVKAGKPELAASIVRVMLDSLSSLIKTASRRKADFIAIKLKDTERDLTKSGAELQRFMEKNRIATVDDTTQQLLKELGDLEVKKMDVDANLASAQSQLRNTGNLDQLADSQVRIKSYAAMQETMQAKLNLLIAKLNEMPAIGVGFAGLQLKLTALSKRYAALTEQYDLARITQKGEDGDYQIIDRPRVNKRKVGPKHITNAVLGGMMSFITGCAFILYTSSRKSSAG